MREASQIISPQDGMWDPAWPTSYRYWGRSAIHCIHRALHVTRVVPERILDLPSGHGRVLRWLAAEFPQATITASDLDRDAVDFCARELGAVPVYSSEAPEEIALGRYDLIWVGSLFTHLDAPLWRRFLSVLAAHLDGVMLFTTAGEHVAERMRAGEDHGVDNDVLLPPYDDTGFGYADYPGQSFGLARAKPTWVLELLEQLPLELVELTVRGWAKRQDVYTVLPP